MLGLAYVCMYAHLAEITGYKMTGNSAFKNNVL